MAVYDRSKDWQDNDGGEAEPRPLKAFRLMDSLGEEATREKGAAKERSRADSLAAYESRGRANRPEKTLPQSQKSRQAPPREPGGTPPVADIPAEGCHVLSVTPEGEGETVAVVLALPDPEGGKSRRVKIHLLTEQYAEMRVQVGVITLEQADLFLEAGKLCAAIRRGMGLLKYGDQSARRLTSKLIAKGIDRETAKAAAEYLSEKGYIREDDTARLRAEQGVRKGWGPRRIREDLWAQGFTAAAAEDALEALSEVDFSENCAGVIRKKYGSVPADRTERQKITAALMRLGYESDDIREAMRRVRREG